MPTLALPVLPDLLALHEADPQRFPVLLETGSGEGWDILLALPQQVHCAAAGAGAAFLAGFEAEWHERPVAVTDAAHVPFRGGWFVYLGYEMLHVLEPSVAARDQRHAFPLAVRMRIPAAIQIDRRHGQAWLFAESAHGLHALQAAIAATPAVSGSEAVLLESLQEEDERIFLRNVAMVQDYIRAGDVFQVNLSRRWHARLTPQASAAQLYRALRAGNPVPFGGIAWLGARQSIVSASPERLLRVEAGRALTRPIAGTWPRDPDPLRDAQQRTQLLAHPKERAEHVMLVDLERNDLGRVCLPGSVQVEELMGVASYAWVHHIESTVSGQLRHGVTPGALLRALFPGGTITGCPKVRTMQIIRELEPQARNAYTGSMGYMNLDGDLDLNILIRSAMVDGQQAEFSAGAGIVADSQPRRELEETRAKARGMLRALGAAAA